MKALIFTLAIAGFGVATNLCPAAEPKKDDALELEPWKHEFYWKEFTLSKDAPVSDDARYRLKIVRKNGEAELFYSPTPEEKESITVKPMPKEFKAGSRPPTIVVKAFDSAKQVVTIRELRIK